MFWSTDRAVCEANRDNFYQYAFICTWVYFITAYCVMHQTRALNNSLKK